jgi:ABC-2 type transport system permease protein
MRASEFMHVTTTWALIRKLLRDVRTGWIVVLVLLFSFQVLWARVAHRIAAELLAGFAQLGIHVDALRRLVFQGSGQVIQALMGGSDVRIERAPDLLSIAYVHPLTQTILCIWAIGRAAGAIAGEIDRGTMELLLAQPLRRRQLISAHLMVDAITIPTFALAMWLGTLTGASLAGFIGAEGLLHVEPLMFLPALVNVVLLLFAVSGLTMAVSAAGRSRNRVLGLAVLIALVQFLVNIIGQLWPPMESLRPATVFYYYQPQPMILQPQWYAEGDVWLRLVVLTGAGIAGYLFALWIFCRRDLPAPL